MLAIDIVEGCNFSCYFCRARTVETNAYIDFDLFKRIISEAKDIGIDRVMLTPNRGEPFLHPDIYEMLEFTNQHMKRIHMFTNATAVNVKRLQALNCNNLDLYISQYGSTVEEFRSLTLVDDKLYAIFNRRLEELTAANIRYTISHRSLDYSFDYDGNARLMEPIDPRVKCQHHYNSKILVNGDVTFCIAAREEFPDSSKVRYANLNEVSLRTALEHPLRYKFMDSQSICARNCTSYNRTCHTDPSIVSLKLLSASKHQYKNNTEQIDQLYADIENNIIQSTK